MSVKSVAIFGASGNVGKFILASLQKSSAFSKVTVISRASSKATFPEGTNVVRGEYNHDFLVGALKGHDAVVCAAAGTALGEQTPLIDAAVDAGVKYFIPSDFGSDYLHPNAVERVPMMGAKVAALNHLKQKAAASNGSFSWISVCCGIFLDWAIAAFGFWSFQVKDHKATLYDEGTHAMDATNIANVGDATARILENADKYKNQVVHFKEYTTTQVEMLKSLEKATGAKFEVQKDTSDNLKAAGDKKLGEGNGMGVVDQLFAALFATGSDMANYSKYAKLANDELGLKHEDLDTVINQVVNQGRPFA